MIKTGDFGVFVIFAAVFAAGILGLPHIPFLQYQITPGVFLTTFVAKFGFPAILGLVLGQFIANSTSPLGALDLVSPAFSFVGLVSIRYLRNRSVLLGSLAYIALTGAWISYMLIAVGKIPFESAILSAFGGQSMPVLTGYAAYRVVESKRPEEYDKLKKALDRLLFALGVLFAIAAILAPSLLIVIVIALVVVLSLIIWTSLKTMGLRG